MRFREEVTVNSRSTIVASEDTCDYGGGANGVEWGEGFGARDEGMVRQGWTMEGLCVA